MFYCQWEYVIRVADLWAVNNKLPTSRIIVYMKFVNKWKCSSKKSSDETKQKKMPFFKTFQFRFFHQNKMPHRNLKSKRKPRNMPTDACQIQQTMLQGIKLFAIQFVFASRISAIIHRALIHAITIRVTHISLSDTTTVRTLKFIIARAVSTCDNFYTYCK